jgi:DNA-directed RNA polymerase subunit RPC12/RpoP
MRRGRKDILVMMKCQKCNGRVFVDRVFSQKLHTELFCILCGKRWMINKETSAFGKWLEKTDRDYEKSSSISS